MVVYFDNASTTRLAPEVISIMEGAMKEEFGNPLAVHKAGREARVKIEEARSQIAETLNVLSSEIIFTSGASEANRIAIENNIFHLDVKHCITSPLEHVSVLKVLETYASKKYIKVDYLKIDSKGHIDLNHLEELLKTHKKSLVCLMHANNEISNLLSIKTVSKLCKNYDSVFLSDMAQTIGHYKIDLPATGVDLACCSAHKFHGPKGVGFLYVNHEHLSLDPEIYGDFYERGIYGAKNLYGILGMAKAFDVFYRDYDTSFEHITELKRYMVEKLENNFDSIAFLGDSRSKGLYTILNVCFPKTHFPETLIMNLDIEGIAASHGTTNSYEVNQRSHVHKALGVGEELIPVRFSFSIFNTKDEIDKCIDVLKKYCRK